MTENFDELVKKLGECVSDEDVCSFELNRGEMKELFIGIKAMKVRVATNDLLEARNKYLKLRGDELKELLTLAVVKEGVLETETKAIGSKSITKTKLTIGDEKLTKSNEKADKS